MSDAYKLTLGGRFHSRSATASSVTNWAVDAATDGSGAIFPSWTTDAITHLGFRVGVRAGTPPTYRISLQSASATTGLPDGTVLGGGSPASATFTPPASTAWDGTWQWVALDNSYTPTRNQMLASCIEYSSGTIDGSNYTSFTEALASVGGAGQHGFPCPVRLTAGTWTKPTFNLPVFGYRTASGRFGVIHQGDYTTTTTTAGHRHTMRFTLPSGHGSTFSVIGARAMVRCPAAGNTWTFGLWDGTTLMQSGTYDSDHLVTANNIRVVEMVFSDATLDALNYGTEYRIGIEVVGGTNGLPGLQLASADDRTAFPYGAIRGLSTWDGSAWTDDDTVLPEVELIMADITEPSGGGGGGPLIGGRLVR